MSNKNNSDIPNIPTSLIVFFLIAATPIGLLLLAIKYLLPILISILSSNDISFGRTNRYSGYEKKGNTVHNDSAKASNTKEKKKSKRERVKIPYSKLSTVLTAAGTALFFVGLAVFGSEVFTHGLTLPLASELSDSLICMGLFGAMGGVGLFLRRKVKLVKKYIAVIGERGAVSLSELASTMSRSDKKVQKELQQVIDSGMFGEYAYIDMGRRMFLRNASFAPAEEKHQRETADSEEESLSEYDRTIRKIKQLNDDIKDERVSERIDRIEDYTRRIFNYLRRTPEKEKDVHTFMTYYLPTTLKLLESYSEIERVGVAGSNMRAAKENIEKTLDMLVEAYKRLLDQLYASENLDISSDIDVLEKMMYKDGLAGKTFGDGAD